MATVIVLALVTQAVVNLLLLRYVAAMNLRLRSAEKSRVRHREALDVLFRWAKDAERCLERVTDHVPRIPRD
jgi:hypothetical protein